MKDKKGYPGSCGYSEPVGGFGQYTRWELDENGQRTLGQLLERCGYIAGRKRGMGNSQARILHILAESPGMGQKELRELLQIEAGSMSEIISKLEQKGLVERIRDSQDRRKIRLNLTAAGREAAERSGGGVEQRRGKHLAPDDGAENGPGEALAPGGGAENGPGEALAPGGGIQAAYRGGGDGQGAGENCYGVQNASEREMFKALTEEEQRTLRELLGKLLRQWRSEYPARKPGT